MPGGDAAAYERCRALFCGGTLNSDGQDSPAKGVAVLLHEGVLAWMQYMDGRDSTDDMETALHFRQSENPVLPEDELVILFATMMGGGLV